MPWLLAGIPMSSLLARKACLLQNSPPQSPSPGSPLKLFCGWTCHTAVQVSVYMPVTLRTGIFLSFSISQGWMNDCISTHYALHISCYTSYKLTFIVHLPWTGHWVRVLQDDLELTESAQSSLDLRGPWRWMWGKKKITFSFALTPTEIQHFLQFWIAGSNTQLHLQYVACCR